MRKSRPLALIGVSFLLMLVLGLAAVHFSLANAQPGLSPLATGHPTNTPQPTPTPLASASISPTSGSVGTLMRVSGSNFGSNESVSITFDNQQIATVGADSSGSFSTSVVVPVLPAGIYQVRIGNIIRSFTITSSFSVTPSSGPPGSSVTVRATGFSPGEDVDITFDGILLIATNADDQGRTLLVVEVPTGAVGGAHSIAATGPSGSLQVTFSVTATLSIDQSEASPGDAVSVSGTGFRANETGISIKFDSQTLRSGITADFQGVWSGKFTVPDTTTGSHTIKASGSVTQETFVTITITPSPTCVVPTNGDWVVGQGCELVGSKVAPADVVIEENVALTITENADLDINFSNFHLLIRSGAKVVIRDGGKIH